VRAPLLFACALAIVLAASPSHAEPEAPAPLPNPPASILAGCSAADRTLVLETLSLAITMGAPTYNAGDYGGCYRIYERAARGLEDELSTRCAGLATALHDGRERALDATNDSDRAWAMRYAFDAVLWALTTY
jgi:hypothetical protein